MHNLSANEAKTQFGEMLLTVQREPVQISRNGKPVAVVVSAEEYQHIEALKLQVLQGRIQRAKQHASDGQYVDGEEFFSQLLDADDK